MKTLLALALVSLCGCSQFTYTAPDGTTFKRASFGSKLNLKTFEMSTATNGVRMIKLQALGLDQVELATSVTAAAVAAAIQSQTGGVKP